MSSYRIQLRGLRADVEKQLTQVVTSEPDADQSQLDAEKMAIAHEIKHLPKEIDSVKVFAFGDHNRFGSASRREISGYVDLVALTDKPTKKTG